MITIVTAVWKRPEIFELFAKGVKHLQTTFPSQNIQVVVAGSEGITSEKMVTDHDFHYIEVPNTPLSAKHNSTLKKAKELGSEYVLCLGSDDIISEGLFKIYLDEISKRTDFVGLGDFYFYDYESGSAAYWGGYIDPKTTGNFCGAGVLLSARFLKTWNWKIWTEKNDAVLDNDMVAKVKMTPCKKRYVSLKNNNVLAVDIKSVTNMTPFDLWSNTKLIKSSILETEFPYLKNEK